MTMSVGSIKAHLDHIETILANVDQSAKGMEHLFGFELKAPMVADPVQCVNGYVLE